jgi:hypothetical protein
MLAGISSSNALLVCNKNVGCGTTQAPDNKSPAWGKSCLRFAGANHFSRQWRMTDPSVNGMITQDVSEDEFLVNSLYIM